MGKLTIKNIEMTQPENCDVRAALKLSSDGIERIKSTIASIPSSRSSYIVPTRPVRKSVKSLSIPRISVTEGMGIALVMASSKFPKDDAPNTNKALSTNGEAREAT